MTDVCRHCGGTGKEPPKPEYCEVCPHAIFLHNPDGSCPCGIDCASIRRDIADHGYPGPLSLDDPRNEHNRSDPR